MMRKITGLFSVIALGMFLLVSCQPEANKIPPCFNGVQDGNETGVDCGGDECAPCPATCSDGILNQGELQIDCGGPCPLCPTCNDGIQNGLETGVDCGGNCPPCPASCTDQILNGTEIGVDCGGSCVACNPQVTSFAATVDGNSLVSPTTNSTIAVGVMNVSGTASGIQISITFAADIDPGTYAIPTSGVAATLNNSSASPSLFSATSGAVVIVSHNKAAKTLSGTFNFTGDNGASETVEVTAGSFSVSY